MSIVNDSHSIIGNEFHRWDVLMPKAAFLCASTFRASGIYERNHTRFQVEMVQSSSDKLLVLYRLQFLQVLVASLPDP